MLHSDLLRRLRIAVLAACSVAAFGASAQPKPPVADGPLDKFINLDANDTATKLDVLTQTLYEQEQRTIALIFATQFAGKIDIKKVMYPSTNDKLIPGYVFRSTKQAAGKRPALILVHGGFHERFNQEWFPLIAEAVSRGYVMMFPEYRGSRGYGAEHYVNDYGNTDVADVLAAGDYLKRQADVDGERLGIIGESRGGMVTLLAIEKEPKKFKAAVDIVGLTDFIAYMGYKPEYRRQEVAKESPSFGGKLPNENLQAYLKASPINYVDAIETPLLVMGTTGDKIAPLSLHGGRLIDVLKARGKTFESKIYENAPGGHIFMHGESPEREDAQRRVFDFVGRYLKP